MTDFDLCEDEWEHWPKEESPIQHLEEWHSNNTSHWGEKQYLHIIATFIEDLSDRLLNALDIIDKNNSVSHDEMMVVLKEMLDRLYKMR